MKSEYKPLTVLPFSMGSMIKWSNGNIMALAGSIGLNYSTHQIIAGGIKAEANLALKNLKELAKDSGF